MQKKILSLLLCAVLLCGLFSGCSAPAAPETPSIPEVTGDPPEPPKPAEPAAPVAPPAEEVIPPAEETAPPPPADAEILTPTVQPPATQQPDETPVQPALPEPVLPTPAPAPKPQTPTITGDWLVGYGREDITPLDNVPLAGYGDTSKRVSEFANDAMYATCVAITDRNGSSVVLYALDVINARDAMVKGIREGLSDRIGLPTDRIFVTCSHTHSGPDLSNTASGFIPLYQEMLIESAVEAGAQAWEDRKNATMYTASANADGLNFVRHYRHEDGTYSGPGFGSSKTPIIGHAASPDPEMRLIRFERQGGKDVLMMNWQAHATMNSHTVKPNTFLSADFISGVREYLETELNCEFAYYQGAAGDLMPTSQIPGEDHGTDIYLYGELLGSVAKTALQQQKKMAAGEIKLRAVPFTAKINHSDDHLLEQAQQVQAYIRNNGGNSGATAYAQTLGLISYHHANSIVRRAAMAQTTTLPCSVLAIGDVGFAAAPNELFGEAGEEIRRGSPYDMTFILGYCNASLGYVPTRRAYGYNSYEVGCSNYAEGTAEEQAAFLSEKLSELSRQ